MRKKLIYQIGETKLNFELNRPEKMTLLFSTIDY